MSRYIDGMNRGIYGAAAAMTSNQEWLDVITHNLANVNTNGYKRDTIQFSDWMDRTLNADGGKGTLVGNLGSGPEAKSVQTVFQKGSLQPTENPFDLAITSDRGLFAIQVTNKAGQKSVQFTRDGSFTQNEQGQLVTREGYAVLDDQMRPIFLEANAKPVVDAMGNIGPVAARPDQDQSSVKIGVFDGQFKKLGGNLWTSSNARAITGPVVQQGFVESSNVNPVESMVQMIEVQRMFELANKMIQTQDESSTKLIDSLRQGG